MPCLIDVVGFCFKDLFIHLRETESGEEAEGKNLQVDSLLSMAPDIGFDLTTHEIMTGVKTKSQDAQLIEPTPLPYF